MTAVEWLEEQIKWRTDISDIIEQAKEMEKQQILDFAYYFRHEEFNKKDLEQYYNEKFKIK